MQDSRVQGLSCTLPVECWLDLEAGVWMSKTAGMHSIQVLTSNYHGLGRGWIPLALAMEKVLTLTTLTAHVSRVHTRQTLFVVLHKECPFTFTVLPCDCCNYCFHLKNEGTESQPPVAYPGS